jgi:phosphatidylinositol-3-phosphatase
VGIDHRDESAYPRAIAARLRSILLLAALLALAAPAAAAERSHVHPATALRSSHLALIVLENREYEEVVDNPEAPYFNHLVERGAIATNFYGVTHPSLPNYLALFAGDTFGIAENCTDCVVYRPNLATQLSRTGISWRAYMESMPSPCFIGADFGRYAKRHNPFVYFPSVTALSQRCNRVVPESWLVSDLERHRLPQFVWLTPDLCHDGHDCKFAAVDYHLETLVPEIIRQLGPRGLLVITFDEGISDSGCCGYPGGGRIPTVLVGPGVPRGSEIRRPADHYSLLASIEDYFDLPRLRMAAAATPLAPALFGATD